MKISKKKKKKSESGASDEEHILSCIVQLFRHLSGDESIRLISKFTEDNHQKIERVYQIHVENLEKLKDADRSFQQKQKLLDLDPEDAEDQLLLARLDAGLFTLNMADLVLAFACYYHEAVTSIDSQITKSVTNIKIFSLLLYIIIDSRKVS
jgi:beta-catenin-like protein 1